MKTNFSLLFYLKKQKNYVSGNVPIYMRITVEGNRAEMATNRDCDPKRWNAKGNRAIGTKEEIKVLNTHLDQLQNAMYYAHQRVFDMGLPITADAIKSSYLGTLTNSHTLLEAVADHNLKMEQLVDKDYVRGTLNRYKVLERHLKGFIPLKYGVADMDIRTIDQAFLNGFDHYLRSEKNCANNYVVKNIKNLGKILRICMENEWIDKSPFTAYKGKTKNVDRFYLNKEELAHIAGKEFLSERLKQVRDVFIFCCFTGLAYVDVFKLKQEDIRKGIDGDRWIFTSRQKTKTRSSVPLLSTAVEIVDRYATNKVCLNKGFLLPVPSNQKMNEYLKEIADLCGIEKKLTSHIARHTFATTVTLLNGVPIESVSKMLGHTSIIFKTKMASQFQIINQKIKNFDSLSTEIKETIENGGFDLFLVDLRLNGNEEERVVNPSDFSGSDLLKNIKRINEGNQVIMFTASNKAWNMKSLLDLGADGYYIKESPEYNFPPSFSKENYKNFKNEVDRCFNLSFLKKIIKIQTNLESSIALDYSSRSPLYRMFYDRTRAAFTISIELLKKSVNSNKYLNLTFLTYYQILEDYANEIDNFDYRSKSECYVAGTRIIDDSGHQLEWLLKYCPDNSNGDYFKKEIEAISDVKQIRSLAKISFILAYKFMKDNTFLKKWGRINKLRNERATHGNANIFVTKDDLFEILEILQLFLG